MSALISVSLRLICYYSGNSKTSRLILAYFLSPPPNPDFSDLKGPFQPSKWSFKVKKHPKIHWLFGKGKWFLEFVVLPIDLFENILDRLEDESDLQAIREVKKEPLYDQKYAGEYIFMNPVKRERLDRGWTQQHLAERLGIKQSTIAKWERKDAVYRKKTRQNLAKVFGLNEECFL